jgi:hypothetical protein
MGFVLCGERAAKINHRVSVLAKSKGAYSYLVLQSLYVYKTRKAGQALYHFLDHFFKKTRP